MSAPSLLRFALAASSLYHSVALASSSASAQTYCAPTSGGGWHQAASGTPGCVNLLPPPGGSVTGTLPSNDDSYTDPIDLTGAFPGGLTFFGGPYDTLVLNNNGNVTFGGSLSRYTPSAFGVSSDGLPMIAAYWADVDTRTGGDPANNYVWWYLERGRMIATWHNVGYFFENDDRKMDFQMIITNGVGCATGDFDVEFRYNRCEWTAGDVSGGSGGLGGSTQAQVGFDARDGTHWVSVPGSLSMDILNVCTGSNVGTPGVWRFSVHGGMVACPGGGTPCDTGMQGACAIGINECHASGVVCSTLRTPSAERCDGVDDNCDGVVDNGDGLCSYPNVCYQGACVPPCFEGGCPDGQSCSTDGICVDTACVGVSCASGQRCVAGSCVDACAGVVCPHDQQCIAGSCVSVCDLITCGDGEVCRDGMCQAGCPCNPCPDGETCNADGSCSPVGCDIVTCPDGYYCQEGSCLDACAGAVCPGGQRCELGQCVDGSSGPGPGVDGGTILPHRDAGNPTGADSGFAGSDAGNGGGTRHPPARPGCGCRAAGSGGAPTWMWALGALALFVRRRRG